MIYFGAAIAIVLALNAVGTLVYSSLGHSFESTAGKYSLVFYVVMGMTVLAEAIKQLNIKPVNSDQFNSVQKWALHAKTTKMTEIIANGSAGAVVGFYYGGTALPLPIAQQPPWAIAGAIVGALMAIRLGRYQTAGIRVGRLGLRLVVMYGAVFLSGAIGMMRLSQGQGWGVGLLGVGLLGIGVMVRSVLQFDRPGF